jgi:hypothetical protein
MVDPTADASMLGDIQRRGLRAAGELVDRLIVAVDGDGGPGDPMDDKPRPTTASPTVDLMRVWLELLQRGVEALEGATGGGGLSGRATADVGAGTATGVVRIRLDGERRAAAEVWLHNGTAEAIADLAFHCSELRAADGTSLPADAIRFSPPGVDELPARSSRGIAVTAARPSEAAAGAYRGVILVAGAPDVWLPLEVKILATPTRASSG